MFDRVHREDRTSKPLHRAPVPSAGATGQAETQRRKEGRKGSLFGAKRHKVDYKESFMILIPRSGNNLRQSA